MRYFKAIPDLNKLCYLKHFSINKELRDNRSNVYFEKNKYTFEYIPINGINFLI